ncbi:MAG: NAD(P)H-dependent glycerol-3-phosphate dehydrogenase [Mariprofundaceae bacterium]|nr:NAD(P)H-dependent glycerol-3-phosphate dehydrogenase [Mariprofundaceae bacterium]
MKQNSVCVLGAGSWGTALAMVLARQGRDVTLIARTSETAERMQQSRENSRYLPNIRFPDSLTVRSTHHPYLEQASAIILALPCNAILEVLPSLSDLNKPIIAACKGLNPQTLERMDETLLHHIGAENSALLSGPSFAIEVAQGMPTAITMAARSESLARHAASFFDDPAFRIYTSTDMTGVAMGGALKNIIAIAAGVAEGLNLGHNTSAALITRGISEISRLAVACGGKPETLSGLSGLGDLVLTCTGSLSRNRKMGIALASGMDVNAARAHVGQVVEGERSALAACRLAGKMGIDMPISQGVQALLSGKISPQEAVLTLLSRPEKNES